MEVHALCPAHADALARFFEVLKAHGIDKTFHPHPFTAEAARDRANYAGQDLYFVLLKGSDVMGYAMLRGWDEGYEVPSLGIALHPDAQGQGLGRLLMEFLHVASLQRGAKTIRLRVYRDNKSAITLYRSLGYKLTQDRDCRYLLGLLDLNCG
jgi:ribosomal protein S18 acetylase RimI-like enzyme